MEVFSLFMTEPNISDYLLKPIDFERFLKAVNKTLSPSAARVAQPSENNFKPDFHRT